MHSWFNWSHWSECCYVKNSWQRPHQSPHCRIRVGRCRIGAKPPSCFLGWCPWNWIWLEIHSEKLWSQHFHCNSTFCSFGFNTWNNWLFSQVHFLSTTALVWLYSRHDLPRQLLPAVIILIGFHSYKSVICDVISHLVHIYSWSLLLFKAFFSLSLALIVLHIYGGVATSVA